MTEISTFIQDFHEAFGEKATLPILFYYSDTPVSFPEKTNGCMFKLLVKVNSVPIQLLAVVVNTMLALPRCQSVFIRLFPKRNGTSKRRRT